eukprot:TRINITY_DN4867_c0_g1_i1.p1 TRINITY_DN4867_c0_g1~~TRINITY_DN4867_c0_g1_i1.p1  ORF type:complete len:575 (+),score=120.56 TRINITY_DN4867_c0_g1_i1:59-1783(+)
MFLQQMCCTACQSSKETSEGARRISKGRPLSGRLSGRNSSNSLRGRGDGAEDGRGTSDRLNSARRDTGRLQRNSFRDKEDEGKGSSARSTQGTLSDRQEKMRFAYMGGGNFEHQPAEFSIFEKIQRDMKAQKINERSALLHSDDGPKPEFKQKPEEPEPEARQAAANRGKEDDLMPFKKQQLKKSPSMVATGTRGAVRAAEESLSVPDTPPPSEPGEGRPVTEDNINLGIRVVRGADWTWGEEDGGSGHVGIILSYDGKKMTCQVLWEKSCQAHSHYRYGNKWAKSGDLNAFRPAAGMNIIGLGRRNSQDFFASKFQTVIILDWDDTLFPTTYVRDELGLSWSKTMAQQDLPVKQKAEVTSKLVTCQNKVSDLLRLAVKAGKVVLVTLARKPWVADSCRNFFPLVGRIIDELNVPIVYAQEGVNVDYNKVQMSSDSELERFWSAMKARVIARECQEFYSQYDGQSWKNVISIGDSDFERLGTMLATKDYMSQTVGAQTPGGKQVEVDGHLYKVRTKTFKMVDQPSIDELNTQLGMLRTWLPLMIKLDNNFDVNINNANDPSVIRRITAALKGAS